MVELIFVLVIIGILSAIAIPRLGGVREDAVIAKGKAEVSSIRAGIALLRSQRLLEGNTTRPQKLDDTTEYTHETPLFNGGTQGNILSSPIYAMKENGSDGWYKISDTRYDYYISGTAVQFTYTPNSGTFDCDDTNATTGTNCKLLTR